MNNPYRVVIFFFLTPPSAPTPARARSQCRVARPLTRFIPDSRTYSVPLSLDRHRDQTPGPAALEGCAAPGARLAADGGGRRRGRAGRGEAVSARWPKKLIGTCDGESTGRGE
jgi:hypothetical protein